MIERLRNAAALRRLKQHPDYLLQEYVRLLQEDNAVLREQLKEMPKEFDPDGRRASGRRAGRVLIVVMIAVLTIGGYEIAMYGAAQQGLGDWWAHVQALK